MEKGEKLKQLGERIATERKRRGLTVEKLAYEVGISKGNLCEIEQGKRDARFTTLLLIAEGLDLTVSALLYEL